MKIGTTVRIVGVLALGAGGGFGLKSVLADGIPSPNPLYYSGTLTEGGNLVNDPARSIKVNLWLNPTPTAGENAVCTTSVTTPVINGRFRVALDSSCKGGINANPNVLVEVVENGVTLPRAKIGAVPYAVEADHAVSATSALSAAYAADAGNVPIITAWQRYSPVVETNGAATLTAATAVGTYRRVGDSLEGLIKTTFQSTPSTGATYYQWTLPMGLSIDTTKIPAPTQYVGGGLASQSPSQNVALVVYERTSTTLSATADNAGSYYVNDTEPFAWASGGGIDIYFTVPIAGWSVTQ